MKALAVLEIFPSLDSSADKTALSNAKEKTFSYWFTESILVSMATAWSEKAGQKNPPSLLNGKLHDLNNESECSGWSMGGAKILKFIRKHKFLIMYSLHVNNFSDCKRLEWLWKNISSNKIRWKQSWHLPGFPA